MKSIGAVHRQRDRAESFGAVAHDYDRYRPSYPTELIDELVGLAGGGPVLDIGTGTGKGARLLADRGLDVLGVEIDPKMAEVARGHGLTVEVGSFESWPDAGRSFSLITAAQAWHWVDPVPGAPKVARLLQPGGAFVPFWNFETPDQPWLASMIDVYAQFAPEIEFQTGSRARTRDDGPYVADLQASSVFSSVTARTIPATFRYPLEHWLGRIGTHSDHLSLGRERFDALIGALRPALAAHGPDVRTTGGTYLLRAEVTA